MVAVAQQHKTPAEQIAFLEKKANDLKANPDSLCLLLSTAAAAYTAEKNFDKAKTTLERVESLLNGAFGLDPIVYSTFYRVLAVFHKAQVHAGEFYKAGLLYLAYTPVESMPLTTQQMMARDLALAGLVAEDVFGLGELLRWRGPCKCFYHSSQFFFALQPSCRSGAERRRRECMAAGACECVQLWQDWRVECAKDAAQRPHSAAADSVEQHGAAGGEDSRAGAD